MHFDKDSGKRILEKMKESFITDQIFIENEYRTNLLVARTMLFMALILMASWGLNEVGVYAIEKHMMRRISIQGLFELVIPSIICLALKGRKRWLKYLLVLEFIVVFARIDSVLTYSVIPIMYISVVLSCCYYSEVFTIQISIVTAILFAVSAFCGSYYRMGMTDLNFFEGDGTNYVSSMMLQSYMPKLMIFILITFICYKIAVRGKKIVLQQHDISEEHARVETELGLASKIQARALPIVHDLPRQDYRSFDLAAMMAPAKEVGGDFYDFFYLDPTHLVLMIADVSGKGVPAALFMMVSKILLDNSIDNHKSPAMVLTEVNHQLCEKKLEDMFVTVWLGILDLETGALETANAGHEYPIICKSGGEFAVFKDKHGFVLGGMDGMRYRETHIQLEPGDVLFVYTDGVPEACNPENEQFGMNRTVESLNRYKNLEMQQLLTRVKGDIDVFADGAPQFDDTTMLALRYERNLSRDGMTVNAVKDSVKELLEYMKQELESAGIAPEKIQESCSIVEVICENIVTNSSAEWMQLIYRVGDEEFQLYLRDNGVPNNPLTKEMEENSMTYHYTSGINIEKVMMKR